MSNYENFDYQDSVESLFENVPQYFFNKKWPFPKLRENGNISVGEDVALSWLMAEKRDRILDEEGIDILNIGRRNPAR